MCASTEFAGRKLEADLASETAGNFKRLLVAQCNASRDENPHVDIAKATKDAKDIFEVCLVFISECSASVVDKLSLFYVMFKTNNSFNLTLFILSFI